MIRQRPSFPVTSGVLCLALLGFLLWSAGSGDGIPGTFGSWIFLTVTLAFSISVALAPSRTGDGTGGLLRPVTLVFAALLLAAGLGFLLAEGDPPGESPGARSRLEILGEEVAALPDALTGTALRLTGGEAPAEFDGNGDLFRRLERLPRLWAAELGAELGWPVGGVVWSRGQRMAWSPGAEPLPLDPFLSGPPRTAPPADRRLVAGRRGWFLQQITPWGEDLLLELQVPVTGADAPSGQQGFAAVIVPAPGTIARVDDEGRPVTTVILDGTRGGAVRLTAPGDESDGGLMRWRARLFLLALLAWGTALTLFFRLAVGPAGILAAVWIARALLAEVELLRWVSGAFPQQVFPAGPDSLVSLVDPAYFATPFAFGWFASSADALLTTALIAGTAWWLLDRQGLVGRQQGPQESTTGPEPWLRGLIFGIAGGLLLLGLRSLAGLLAENANARLIGQGVSLSYLSFWCLQVALMLASFSLAALVTGFGGRSWPGRERLGAWLGGAGLAMAATLAVGLGLGGLTVGGALLASAVVGGLWAAGSALRARPAFLRRFVWPLVVLLTVVWNYGSLREIYDQAERSWLQRKGDLITQADQDWTRYLLGSVLEDMRDQDVVLPAGPGGANPIWSDEAAWQLWRDSALRDLGYSCLVMLLDAEERQESLFARGFLRDYRYEIADRSAWLAPDGEPVGTGPVDGPMFQVERRVYAGGEEEVLNAEIPRRDGRGWIRVELPLRSWRIGTQLESLGGGYDLTATGYRPRSEIDRPVVLLLADDTGWLAAGATGFPDPSYDPVLDAVRAGRTEWIRMNLAGSRWLCLWNPLPAGAARTPGEGFLLGLRRPGPAANLLDLSRLMLLNLILYFLIYGLGEARRWLVGRGGTVGVAWSPGFQERFLSGYLFLGLVLLLVVGTSVDRVGHERIRDEARERTRAGMSLAVEQLRSLLVEQAAALAESDYIADLLAGQLAGNRPVGPVEKRQGMVFAADGTLLLDETLSNLDADEARALLAAGRAAPMVVVREPRAMYVGTVIPLELRGYGPTDEDEQDDDPGHGNEAPGGFFFYRQELDTDLINEVANLARGQAMLRFDGVPVLASHPGPVFGGRTPLLADPAMMASLFDHPAGTDVFASEDRPFAFTGTHPLPAFARGRDGGLDLRAAPAVLALDFPDREREYATQRRSTILFLAGLANLILLTALVLALLLSWNIFRPLRLLLTATRSLAQGDFAAPLPEAGRDEIGRLAGAFGLMRNDLRSARSRLEARERFLTTVLDRVTVGVAVLDDSGERVALNPTGREILTDFYPARDPEASLEDLAAALSVGGKGSGVRAAELRSPDGRRTLRGSRAPLELPGGRTDTMLVFEDITEFLATQKMAINAELARQVAHEIKNPLTPIQLSVQLLDQARRDGHPDLDRILEETVVRVLDQVALLRSIAGEFSLLGRPGDLETEPVDLKTLVGEVAAGYGSIAADGDAATAHDVPRVAVEGAEVPPVRAHRESLLKILGNLMQNSLDAARPGEPIRVGVGWIVTPETVTMIWRDDGEGLPAEVADRLFDPYFSTKSKGTGLGLAICRNLADRMDGRITLMNRTDGPGARADLTLPRAEPEESA